MLGLYPTWLEPGIGSGWVIAFIATIHVLFSHAAVGGAILFGWLANVAVRKNRPEYLHFIRRYGLFLLIFSYVLGSITGPGIWFSATIASPRGISALIHSFVWVWATEWVFFLIEVIGVYLLIYLAGKVDPKTHTRIASIFCLASAGTLFVIVGVLSFMMWPGSPDWFTKGGVLRAYFGESTFAQVAARLAFVMTIAAVVGGMVAGAIKHQDDKRAIARTLAIFGIVGAVLGYLAFKWYMTTLPYNAQELIYTRLPSHFADIMLVGLGVTVLWFLITFAKPQILRPWTAGIMTLVILILGIAPEEMAREILRKPWIAGQYIYGNQVIGHDVPALGIKSEIPLIAEKGILKVHPFVPDRLRTITDQNRVEAGEAIALTMCSNCHSLTNTGIRPLKRFFPVDSTVASIEDYLGAGLYRGHTMYMPAVPLPTEERHALAEYIKTMVDRYAQNTKEGTK